MAQFFRRVWAKATCSPEAEPTERQHLLAKEHLGKHASSFGEQSISTVGSYILNINNIIGPAVVTLPGLLHVCTPLKPVPFLPCCHSISLVFSFSSIALTFRAVLALNFCQLWFSPLPLPHYSCSTSAGWLTPLIILIVMQILSALSATMISEAMQRIPGNQHFLRRFEFGTVMLHYFGRVGFIIGQILLNICLQASNIASIVVAAQVLDDFLVYTFKASYAFDFAHGEFIKSHGSFTDDNPFSGHIWTISLGYVIAMVICIPFGFLNLDENMWFQWFSFLGMMASFVMFYILFILAGAGVVHSGLQLPTVPPPPPSPNITVPLAPPPPHSSLPDPANLHWDASRVPVVGSLIGQANVIGTVIFMSAFVTTIPSWVNEKQPHVGINKSIWSSTLTSNFIKLSFGYLAAITYVNKSNSSNILNIISRHAPPGAFGVITRISVYLFNFATIIPGIPVISILVRYNLVSGKLCPPWVANLIGVVAPWVVSMFFYHGKGLSMVVNWSAILFQGFVNFAIPGVLYWLAVRWYPNFPDVIQEREEESAESEAPPVLLINANEPPQLTQMERRHTKREEDGELKKTYTTPPVYLEDDFDDDSSSTNSSSPHTPTPDTTSEASNSVKNSADTLEPPASDELLQSEAQKTCDQDPELAAPSSTPGWFFANQKLKVRPVDALPRFVTNKWKLIIAMSTVVILTGLTLTALIMDFYFLAKHQDIVDN